MNELTHLFNFKRSVVCNQISPKHVHDTSASRSIFFAINAQIVLKFSPYLARGSPIIFHTKILPIGSKYLHIADICSPKQNCTPDRRPFHLEATAASYRHALRSNAITQKGYSTTPTSLSSCKLTRHKAVWVHVLFRKDTQSCMHPDLLPMLSNTTLK